MSERKPTYLLGINVGFVTNSSSMVHHFPRQLLDDPKVKAFLEAFGVEHGVVGDNLWHRGACTTIAITKEQKQEVVRAFAEEEYSHPHIDVNSDEVVVIYGDEYTSVANTLAHMLSELCRERDLPYGGDEYN